MENKRDELFQIAAKLTVEAKIGSTSMLQRRLKLGYMRACRIMDDLENAGIVGKEKPGGAARDVLIKDEFQLSIHFASLETMITPHKITCPECSGSGEIRYDEEMETCPVCEGEGKIIDEDDITGED